MAADGNYVNESDIDNWTDELTEDDKLGIVEGAERKVEELTKDVFYPKAFVKYFDGKGKDRMFLNFTATVLTVTEILVFGVELDSSWWTFDEQSVYLDPEAASAGLPELHLRMKETRALFPKGNNNIKITGTIGHLTCPAPIKRAIIMLCRAENDSSLYSQYNSGFESERLGDYSYKKQTTKTEVVVSGVTEVDDLLKRYVRNRPMMGAV